ncbi:MAG TPA: hypothetical protein VNM24_01620 [Burkholderiales bacterium]|nr:hypothetical protein [Burkholderiales bacterium]
MSLRGKDFRCEIDPELHAKLRQMAEFNDRDLAQLGARLLEKAIVAEWHEFSLLLARAERSGIGRQAQEDGGSPRKIAELGGRRR